MQFELESKLSKIIYVACLTIFLAGLGSWAVLAHQETTGASQTRANHGDAQFARAAAFGNLAEIQLGKLAADRASSDVVKAFALRMVTQHGAATDQLKAAAQKDNIALPDRLNSRDQQIYDHLVKLHGAAFDHEYAKRMVDDHEKDLTDFQNEAGSGQNDGMKAFASSTIPMIQEHLNQAREMLAAVSQQSARIQRRATASSR
jgi:putative membrane protein